MRCNRNHEPQRSAVLADKRMGMLQFLMRLTVLLYIAVFVMIYKKSYDKTRAFAAHRHLSRE